MSSVGSVFHLVVLACIAPVVGCADAQRLDYQSKSGPIDPWQPRHSAAPQPPAQRADAGSIFAPELNPDRCAPRFVAPPEIDAGSLPNDAGNGA